MELPELHAFSDDNLKLFDLEIFHCNLYIWNYKFALWSLQYLCGLGVCDILNHKLEKISYCNGYINVLNCFCVLFQHVGSKSLDLALKSQFTQANFLSSLWIVFKWLLSPILTVNVFLQMSHLYGSPPRTFVGIKLV